MIDVSCSCSPYGGIRFSQCVKTTVPLFYDNIEHLRIGCDLMSVYFIVDEYTALKMRQPLKEW